MTPARHPLSDAEVNALFTRDLSRAAIVRCDNCSAVQCDNNTLEFGGDSGYEMPVLPGTPLETELSILRRRHGRDAIILCYPCTDALEEPPFGYRAPKFIKSVSASIPARDEMPRLFAVE